ncbi:MAG TPA: response regulator [Nitrospirota bacterium]|nr:response regulator [Nitrospirota bacterium]
MVDVLVVDDEINFLKDLAEGLHMYSNDIYVIAASSGEKALEILNTAKIDVVLTDLRMPGMGGLNFIKEVSSTHPDIPVIIMSACARTSMECELPGGCVAYLEKPVGLDEVADAIHQASGKIYGRRNGHTQRSTHD